MYCSAHCERPPYHIRTHDRNCQQNIIHIFNKCMRVCFQALMISSELYLRVNSNGVLCVQHKVRYETNVEYIYIYIQSFI